MVCWSNRFIFNKNHLQSIHSHLGREDIVELLLANGASINHKNSDGWSAIAASAFSGHKNVVELLIKSHADVHSKDPTKRTPIYLAARQGTLKSTTFATAMEKYIQNHFFYFGCSLGHDTIVDLLIQNGASNDINKQVTDPAGDGDTSLHAAVLSGNFGSEIILMQWWIELGVLCLWNSCKCFHSTVLCQLVRRSRVHKTLMNS